MSGEILRLERLVEDVERGQARLLMASYLHAAVTLRDQLIRVSCEPQVTIEAMPSFYRLLAEATLATYRWAVAQVSEVRRLASGQRGCPSSPPVALDDLCVFGDLSRLCATFGGVPGRRLVKTLEAVDDVLCRLVETRDQIRPLLCTRAV